jgi:hypothetical protein
VHPEPSGIAGIHQGSMFENGLVFACNITIVDNRIILSRIREVCASGLVLRMQRRVSHRCLLF